MLLSLRVSFLMEIEQYSLSIRRSLDSTYVVLAWDLKVRLHGRLITYQTFVGVPMPMVNKSLTGGYKTFVRPTLAKV